MRDKQAVNPEPPTELACAEQTQHAARLLHSPKRPVNRYQDTSLRLFGNEDIGRRRHSASQKTAPSEPTHQSGEHRAQGGSALSSASETTWFLGGGQRQPGPSWGPRKRAGPRPVSASRARRASSRKCADTEEEGREPWNQHNPYGARVTQRPRPAASRWAKPPGTEGRRDALQPHVGGQRTHSAPSP